MRDLATLLLLVAIGCVVAFVVAIADPGSFIRFGNSPGADIPSTTVLWLAPIIFVASLYVRRKLRRAWYRRRLQERDALLANLHSQTSQAESTQRRVKKVPPTS